ncbi:type VII secretion-associated serine protease mycosin [Streptomyces luomodiensis]|uniref:Type VII secretion-associated serine protease mycosin n=1 Tax=Streptomyces luomodiensis TaxID=3026192 RepID=A0ABY9V2V1_9ACTN|nr:type VII secretion-associated serine protease mycosin [Streptomyces sp. SCA4-21]WNE99214.1 type VII secretion-associated serine protease mycosin [Streptomyces sp. SCA4-21]
MRRIAALSSAVALACLTGATGAAAAPPAAAVLALDGNGECTFPMKKQIKGTPWSLQRLVFDRLWEDTKGKEKNGKPVRVAVIDTGVDDTNIQLKTAVDKASGANFLPPAKDASKEERKLAEDPTVDEVGHGTKVAGIIAARPREGTGFVGLAPEATIIPLKQNNAEGKGTPQKMAEAIRKAVKEGARVINISQDTKGARSQIDLEQAVAYAVQQDVVVVAAAGNDGADGESKRTYPASYSGVLAVAASDRNNERAYFSQSGDFVGVAAPGVDMVSTVPKGGQCVDNGTSFAAPYVAGVAALIRAKHPDWSRQEVIAQIEQTAERGVNGRDRYIGWGVVDPVKALTDDDKKIERPTADTGPAANVPKPEPGRLTLGETPQERRTRLATYALGTGAVVVAITAGGAVVLRDWRRRRDA